MNAFARTVRSTLVALGLLVVVAGVAPLETVAGQFGAVHRIVGRVAGVVFLLAGLHDTLVYWWL